MSKGAFWCNIGVMSMDHLTKQQVVLICLLVAIVTSITTGIVTVSLSDQSGGGVSNTIYQVVEKTIEKVVPDSSPVKKITEKENISKELSLTAIAEKFSKNLVRIYRKDGSGNSTFLTVAIAVGDKGALLGPESINPFEEGESLKAILSGGEEIDVTVARKNLYSGLDIFLVKDQKNISKLSAVSLGGFSSLNIGTNVVAFGGKESDNVISTGIIGEFKNGREDNATSTAKNIAVTNINLSSPLSGVLLVDTSGKAIGFVLPSEALAPARFIDAGVMLKSAGSLI